MTPFELHDQLLHNRELIYDTWNFFVSVHLALLGVIFVADGQHKSLLQRLLIVPAYGGFMVVNYRAQVDNYGYAQAILGKIGKLDESARIVASVDRAWIADYLLEVYAGAAMLSVLLIIFTIRWSKSTA
jgi:hypothetical protein